MAQRPLFPFQQAQYDHTFPLKPAPSCKLFAGLGGTSRSSTSHLFSYLTLAMSSSPSFLLPQSLWQIWQKLFSLSSCFIRLQWVPEHLFLRGNNAAYKLAKREALLVPLAIPCSLSCLISRIHSCLFSDWRHTVSSQFLDTQAPSISIEELVFLRHARCVLSRLRCNGHSLMLSSYLSMIGIIENLSCSACGHPPQDISFFLSFCTVQLRTLCPPCFLAIFCLSTTSSPCPGEFPGYRCSMVFRDALIPREGLGNNNNNSKIEITDALLRNKGS